MQIIAGLCLVLICGGSVSAISEPNEQEMQLAAEKMQNLKVAYQEYEIAVESFLELNRKMAKEQPDLAAAEVAMLKVDDLRSGGLPYQSEYTRWLHSFGDTNRGKDLYEKCRRAFHSQVISEVIRDPNWESLLRPSALFYYRLDKKPCPSYRKEEFKENLKKYGFTVFDPQDSDNERLWKNIKQCWSERSEKDEDARKELIEKEGIPECVVKHVEGYELDQFAFSSSSLWLSGNVSRESPLVESAKQIVMKHRKLSDIHRDWRKLTQYLTDKFDTIDISKFEQPFYGRYDEIRAFLAGGTDRMDTDEGVDYVLRLSVAEEVCRIIESECAP